MNIEQLLKNAIKEAFKTVFQLEISDFTLQSPNKGFEGTHTFLTFPYTKTTAQPPEKVGEMIGEHLKNSPQSIIQQYNVTKGFLNVSLKDSIWIEFLQHASTEDTWHHFAPQNQRIMVEFSSPNTNKPLHLGHLRNIFLGDSLSKILTAVGYEVIKANLVNDRGIHICKSMVAYKNYGKGETPQDASIKGDKWVGSYYVRFEKEFKKGNLPKDKLLSALEKIIEQSPKNDYSLETLQDTLKETLQTHTPLWQEAQEMLQKWEQNDPETVALWKQMNQWVYEGFDKTYQSINIAFDKTYYESNTYLLGKDIVEEGLQKKVFFKKEDGSVWADLTPEKLDQKLVLRKDGTSVYITQDLGTADLKYNDFNIQKSVYVVGDEQEYHFKVLFAILKQLGRPYAEGLHHLSYGMVDLPSGKMKSREGTVVDADDLIEEMIQIAQQRTEESGMAKLNEIDEQELQKIYHQIGVGALKYFLLKVEPRKRMLFNPENSIDFEGDASPFVQYNYARTQAIIRKAKELNINYAEKIEKKQLEKAEQHLIQTIYQYKETLEKAAQQYAPSFIVQYVYDLARAYSRFFTECAIFKANTEEDTKFRITLTEQTGKILKRALQLLGIEAPERM
ncbi:MAG: arginine--tRNA ligase [Cytophagales bacterium]|nr:MAG: arginine--tRNA ligase [Cytophagales bacterium]